MQDSNTAPPSSNSSMAVGADTNAQESVTAIAEIELDHSLTLVEANAIANRQCHLRLSEAAIDRLAAAHQRLNQCISDNRMVYGVTTGFGPLADRPTSTTDIHRLQTNLVAHLATGVGPPLDWVQARAVILARLLSLLQGVSGASVATTRLLSSLLASPFAPCIPERGTVGASGDLTPLAHAVLALQGRGGFLDPNNRSVAPETVFAALDVPPLTLSARDGLALVNGTSAMTGIAVVNAAAARRALDWGVALCAALAEALRGRIEAWDKTFATVRPHPGQRHAQAALSKALSGAGRVERRPVALDSPPSQRLMRPPQDAYTLRCAPQILGACFDTLEWHDTVVTRELNAATDNPIFPEPPAAAPALHGGNFMGQHVAFAADALSNAIIVAAGLAERQIARLTDENLNDGLPAFLHRGDAGFNSGLMGAQVTASALHAEMRSRAIPASIQSISTNAANQDVVSMGTIAARRTAEHLKNTAEIHAILAIALAQAADILDQHGKGETLSPAYRSIRAWVREISPPLIEDRPLSSEISQVAARIARENPPAA